MDLSHFFIELNNKIIYDDSMRFEIDGVFILYHLTKNRLLRTHRKLYHESKWQYGAAVAAIATATSTPSE